MSYVRSNPVSLPAPRPTGERGKMDSVVLGGAPPSGQQHTSPFASSRKVTNIHETKRAETSQQ